MKFAIRLALMLSAFVILQTQLASAATTIQYLQFPQGTVQGSTLNLPLTLNLPCYGRVLVTSNPNPPTSSAPGGVTFFHQTGAESQSPQNNPAISWGADTDRFNVLISGATSSYTIDFTFLDGVPNASRLFLIVVGLAVGTTATVSTSPASPPGSLAGEYTFTPQSMTTILTGSVLSGVGPGDPVNTGWALYQTQPTAVLSSVSVAMQQRSGDGVGWTLAYSCPAAAIPTLTTQASPAVALGAVISDTATLSGGATPTGTITFNLYGPNDATCTGAAIFTSTVTVSGNGNYASGSFTPTIAGTYRWIANYSGDANNAGTANACNAANENVAVAPVGAAIPTLSEWAMIMLAALLVLFAWAGIRRHAM